MDALANGCSGNMDGTIVRAWMLWPMDALGTWTAQWFGHGCSGQWMHWEHGRHYRSGSSGQWMHWEHGRYHRSGMDALANGCTGNMDGTIFRAWMLWPTVALIEAKIRSFRGLAKSRSTSKESTRLAQDTKSTRTQLLVGLMGYTAWGLWGLSVYRTYAA